MRKRTPSLVESVIFDVTILLVSCIYTMKILLFEQSKSILNNHLLVY